MKSFVRACEATADSKMPNLDSLDKEIATKQPLLQKAISQPDTVQTATVDMAMQVVQLLHRKYEGEQCLSCGVVHIPTNCVSVSVEPCMAMQNCAVVCHARRQQSCAVFAGTINLCGIKGRHRTARIYSYNACMLYKPKLGGHCTRTLQQPCSRDSNREPLAEGGNPRGRASKRPR